MMTRIDSLVVETTVKPTATPRLRRPAVPAPATSAFMPAEAIGAHWLVPAFLAIGIIFRLVAYFAHRSLWLDEAMLVPLGERIANLLMRRADGTRSVTITHQQLADHLGVTREATTRELATLAGQKILRTGRNRITLL